MNRIKIYCRVKFRFILNRFDKFVVTGASDFQNYVMPSPKCWSYREEQSREKRGYLVKSLSDLKWFMRLMAVNIQ